MKISRNTQNNGLSSGNAFLLVCPLPSKLDRSLNGFRTSIHRENHFVAKHCCDLVGKTAENTVIECAR